MTKKLWQAFKRIVVQRRASLTGQEALLAETTPSIPVLEPVVNHILNFLKLLEDVWNGDYRAPVETIIMIVAALLYLVWVFDVIPDFLPVIGYMDDIAVISAAAASCARELEKYRHWRKKRHR